MLKFQKAANIKHFLEVEMKLNQYIILAKIIEG